METKEIEQLVESVIKQEGWTLDPWEDLGGVVEELGELSREIRRIEKGRERPDEKEPPYEVIKENLKEELGDVFFPLVKIAHHYGITLEEAFMAHYNKIIKRYDSHTGEDD